MSVVLMACSVVPLSFPLVSLSYFYHSFDETRCESLVCPLPCLCARTGRAIGAPCGNLQTTVSSATLRAIWFTVAYTGSTSSSPSAITACGGDTHDKADRNRARQGRETIWRRSRDYFRHEEEKREREKGRERKKGIGATLSCVSRAMIRKEDRPRDKKSYLRERLRNREKNESRTARDQMAGGKSEMEHSGFRIASPPPSVF